MRKISSAKKKALRTGLSFALTFAMALGSVPTDGIAYAAITNGAKTPQIETKVETPETPATTPVDAGIAAGTMTALTTDVTADEPKTVKVRFDANGGEGHMDDFEVTLNGGDWSVAETPFTRDGYRFVGWSVAADVTKDAVDDPETDINESLTGVVLADKQEFVDFMSQKRDEDGNVVETHDFGKYVNDDVLTLYAQWEKVETPEVNAPVADENEVVKTEENVDEVVGNDEAVDTSVAKDDAIDDAMSDKELDKEFLSGAFGNKTDGGVADKVGTSNPLSRKLTASLMAAAAPSLTVQASPTGSRAGTAYAVLDSAGTLTLFRSTTTYTAGTGKTVKDVMGKTYTGQVFTGIETSTGTSSSSAKWYSKRTSINLAKIADGQVIAPKSCAGWFYYCSKMTAFEGAERLDTSAVTSMNSMFSDCQAMTEPPAVGGWNTSAVTNMDYLFYNCSVMTVPPSVGSWNTSKVTGMSGMFGGCSSMTVPPVVSGWNTGAVTNMGYMFGSCSKMTEPPAVGSWNTSVVTNMSLMFNGCSAMTEPPAVGSWNTGAVTDMSGVFSSCSKMTVPPAVGSWNTSAVTNMNAMFSGCSKMTVPPVVGGWNTNAVTNIGYMFSGCSAMTVPPAVGSWNTSVVTAMGNMFYNCKAMTEPPAVGSWNTSAATYMGSMFNGCSKMTSLDVSGWDFSKVTNSAYYLGLQNCSALRELKVPAGAKITGLPEHSAQGAYLATWGNADRGVTGSTAANMVTTINAGNGVGTWTWELDPRAGTAYSVLDSAGTLTFFRSMNTYTAGTGQTVTDIMGNMYTGEVFTGVENTGTSYSSVPWYSKRTSVKLAKIADGQVIAPVSCADWFYYCSNMTAFEGAERLDTSAVTTMYYMFSNCRAMTEPPAVGNWNTSAVTNMASMFFSCRAMMEPPVMSSWNTSKVTDMSSMFSGCSAMMVPPAVGDWDTSAVTNMASMFYNCSAMTVPPVVSSWNTSAVTNMSYMFGGCSKMTEPPSVGGWNTSAVTTMWNMFANCSKMTESPAVGGWNTSAVTSMANMFFSCRAMTEPPAVGNWNTGSVTDMGNMFSGCRAMTEPPVVGNWNTGSVTNMASMFSDCKAMIEPPVVDGWNTSKVTNMGSMFSGCLAMTEPPVVGNWNTSKVVSMASMFRSCSAMTEPPSVGSWNTSAVTTMSVMFFDCSVMAEPPAVSNWNTSAVTDMSGMFSGCSAMTSLDVSGWDFSVLEVYDNPYDLNWTSNLGLDGCSALRELKVPAGAKIAGLPEHSAQGDYLATWGNADRGITGSTAANLVTTVNAGNGAGTWTWDLAGYTVNFMVDGSGTAMQAERVKADEDYVVPSCEVTKLYHDFVEWSGSDGNTYHAGDTVTAGTFSAGETLTLTAVFEPHEYGPGEFDGNLQFTVPASINFVVEPDGTLTGPSNASIVNTSGVNTRVSSVEVKELGNFNFVANAEASGEQNAVELRFGPLSDMLDAASFLSKSGVTDSAWAMGTATGQNTVQLETEGKVAHVGADITKVNKFGEIRWYVKAEG